MSKEEEIKEITANSMFAKFLNAFAKKLRKQDKEDKKQKKLDSLIEEAEKGNDVSAKTLTSVLRKEVKEAKK